LATRGDLSEWIVMVRVGTFPKLLCVAFVLSSACETRGDARATPEPHAGRPAGNIAWFHDLFEAHKVSADSGRPMLIVFGAEWCHFCKEMDKTTLHDPTMVAYVEANFIPVHLDADRDKRIAEILKIKPIPCTVVLSPNADLLAKIVGYQEVAQYHGELEKSRIKYLKMQRRK
jgi:thioredoxin-related protein